MWARARKKKSQGFQWIPDFLFCPLSLSPLASRLLRANPLPCQLRLLLVFLFPSPVIFCVLGVKLLVVRLDLAAVRHRLAHVTDHALMHATAWLRPLSIKGGAVSRHSSMATGQRGWKQQPDGGLIGLGTSPNSIIRSRFSSRKGSGTGTAESNALV